MESKGAVILVIDDSHSVREEVKKALTESEDDFTFLEAENGLAGFKLLLENSVDLVLCDLVMPQMDGFKFLSMRRSRRELEDVPVIMLTAVGDVEKKIRMLSEGAGDYLVKPFHPGELRARTLVHLKRKLLQDELRQKNKLLTKLSTTDGLTGIYNRRHFLDVAHAEIERSHRQRLNVSLLIFDVDKFKDINDTFGHQIGDRVLVVLCDETRKKLREYDIFGRYGGDEFTVLFPHTNLNEAFEIAERLREHLSSLHIEGMDDACVSISGGIADLGPARGSFEAMIKSADGALYRGKAAGRGRIEVCAR